MPLRDENFVPVWSRYREVYWPDFPDHLVTKRFILGVPPLPPYPTHPSAVSRMRVLRELEEENSEFNDMVILDVSKRSRR